MMNIILEIWIISGIFAFVCFFVSPYIFYQLFAGLRGLPPISIEEHLILTWQKVGGKIVTTFLSCLLLGPIALIKVNIDAYDSVNDIEDK